MSADSLSPGKKILYVRTTLQLPYGTAYTPST